MPRLLLIVSQSDYLIEVVETNSLNDKQCRSRSVGFLTDLNLYCLKRQGSTGSAGSGL